jgi:hypothetical protein
VVFALVCALLSAKLVIIIIIVPLIRVIAAYLPHFFFLSGGYLCSFLLSTLYIIIH